MAQHTGLQLGKPMAPADSAGWHFRLVSDQPAAAAGKDRWAAGQARAILLADASRRTPDTSAVRCDVATDRAVAASGKLTMIARPNQIAEEKGGGKSV